MPILSQQKQSQAPDFPNVRPSLDLRFALAKKLDPRITFTRASSGTYFGPDGLMRTAGVNEPRFDHDPITGQSLGLLIEERRTNGIRNNTFVGAVVGNPGTLPTNWFSYGNPAGSLTGISSQIIGTGIETNGVNYIDIRLYGTPSVSGVWSILPDDGSSNPAATGQTWSSSFWLKISGGSTTGITFPVIFFDENNSGTGYITGGSYSVNLSTTFQRVSATRTLNGGASVNIVSSGFRFSLTAGRTIDITVRIGLPQLEQGAFITTPILTSGSTATRTADTANITNISSFFNASEGTLCVDSEIPHQTNLKFPSIGFTRGAGSANTINFYYYNTSTPYVAWLVRNTADAAGGGTLAANLVELPGPNQTVGVYKKFIGTYKFGEFNYYFDGKYVNRSITNKRLPSNLTYMEIGTNGNSDNRLNGHIRRITYYPIQLTNQQLINLTS